MTDNRTVTHDGVVVEAKDRNVKVRIIAKSACADCHAKGVCTAADMDEKIIDAISPVDTRLHKGDTVRLVMEERLGWLAIFYGFFLPFLLMVTVLIVVSALGGSEAESALMGLGSLAPYYLLLYVFRHKVEKDFIFKAEKKNKL